MTRLAIFDLDGTLAEAGARAVQGDFVDLEDTLATMESAEPPAL
jgi:phosphoglycolate phosphatase-like HAD superfamily hydrolase